MGRIGSENVHNNIVFTCVYFVFGIAVSILFLKAARFDPWPESGRQSVEWLKTVTAWTVFRRCRLWENLLFLLWANCSTAKSKHVKHMDTFHIFSLPISWCGPSGASTPAMVSRLPGASGSIESIHLHGYLLGPTHVASCSPLFGHVQTYSEHVLPTNWSNWFSSTQVHVFPTSVAQSHPLSHILDRLRWVSAVCLATALVGHARLCTKAGCCGGGTPPAQRRWFEHQLLFNHESEPSNYFHIFSRLI